MTYTNKNENSQTHYAVDNRTIGDLINGYDYGGVDGAALLVLLAAQFAMMQQNYNLASDYYDTNKTDFDFFVSTYQARMASSLTEARTRPFYGPGGPPQYGSLDYLSNTGRGMSKASYKLDHEWLQTRRRISKYTVGQGRRADYKYSITRYNAELEGWNLGFRYEDTRKQKYDEQRHAHQTEILNIGISAGNSARAGLATSVERLSGARSDIASNIASFGNGLSRSRSQDATAEGVSKLRSSQLASSNKALGGIMSNPPIDLRQPKEG